MASNVFTPHIETQAAQPTISQPVTDNTTAAAISGIGDLLTTGVSLFHQYGKHQAVAKYAQDLGNLEQAYNSGSISPSKYRTRAGLLRKDAIANNPSLVEDFEKQDNLSRKRLGFDQLKSPAKVQQDQQIRQTNAALDAGYITPGMTQGEVVKGLKEYTSDIRHKTQVDKEKADLQLQKQQADMTTAQWDLEKRTANRTIQHSAGIWASNRVKTSTNKADSIVDQYKSGQISRAEASVALDKAQAEDITQLRSFSSGMVDINGDGKPDQYGQVTQQQIDNNIAQFKSMYASQKGIVNGEMTLNSEKGREADQENKTLKLVAENKVLGTPEGQALYALGKFGGDSTIKSLIEQSTGLTVKAAEALGYDKKTHQFNFDPEDTGANTKLNKLPNPSSDPEQTKATLDTSKEMLSNISSATPDNREKITHSTVKFMNETFRGTKAYDNFIDNPKELQGQIDYLSNPSVGAFLVQHTSEVTPEARRGMYDTLAAKYLRETNVQNTKFFGSEVSYGRSKFKRSDLYEVDMSGGEVHLEWKKGAKDKLLGLPGVASQATPRSPITESDPNEYVFRAQKEMDQWNRTMGRALTNTGKAMAHLSGTMDYTKFFKENGKLIFSFNQ